MYCQDQVKYSSGQGYYGLCTTLEKKLAENLFFIRCREPGKLKNQRSNVNFELLEVNGKDT